MRTRTVGASLAAAAACTLVVGVLAAARPAAAQTPFVPYFGKNLVHYANFRWQSYTTDHFQIYYYPEVEHHLERVAGYAESAYQQVSADLKHDLAFKVPLVIFKTHVEFEQQNVIPGAAQEGVAAFAESTRNRMLLPLDEPPDLLYRTITHELTHIFEFDIIPQSLIRRDAPLWINEGLSDFLAGYWAPLDLATVRDAAVADIIPKMSELEGYGNFTNPRLIYNLGHAAFEFMESRWGKEGIRQFLFSLRKSVIGGGENAYDEAFKMKPDEFDQAFEKYLKDRFKPFRDKERPADYGRDLAPNPEKSNYSNALTVEPSPSGDLFAVVTGNRKDREYDIVLVSAKDGQVVRNLTPGFDKDMKFDYLSIPGTRWNTVPWLAWSPGGDRIAFVVRMGKGKGILLEDIVTRDIVDRIDLKTVDEPESPAIAPGGRTVVFSALQNAKSDIWSFNLDTRELTNLTNDNFYNYAPTYSPDGKFLVYLARVSGNEKLFRLDLDTKKKTQLTFGTHDDAAARFVDGDTLVFASTATDPTQPIEPEVAKNGNIYNIWTLNLKNGELKQYTDSLGGNVNPVALRDAKVAGRVAFITYYKGDYGLHTLDLTKPLKTASTSDFGAPGPIIDFQAPLSHTLVAQNKKKKGTFEKLFVDGRPPVNVGVTNNGDIFGGTELSFSDVLGDHRFSFSAASIAQYRTIAGSYINLSRRLQWAVQGFSQTVFYYGYNAGLFYDPAYSPFIDRDLAQATRTLRGGTVFGIYPLDMYRRLELSGGLVQFKENYNDPSVATVAQNYQQSLYGRNLFNNGTVVPLGISFVQETTVFREFGPLAGNTMRLAYEYAPKIGNTLQRQTFDGDARYYKRLAGTGLLAMRLRGFKSMGSFPDYTYFGGNSEMRGYDYLEFIGQNAVFANAELRFPLIEAMLTPVGVMGGVRGVFFFNVGGGWFNDSGFKFYTKDRETYSPFLGAATNELGEYIVDDEGNPVPVYAPPRGISGFRLRDARASYGFGLETFALGFPIHFDWSYRTLFNKNWENALFATQEDLLTGTNNGGNSWRKARFSFWIGYDF
jgi:Tol biopolymer transport system component